MGSRDQIVVFKHNGMYIEYIKNDKGLWHLGLNADEMHNSELKSVPYPNFHVGITGLSYGFNPALVTGFSSLPSEMHMVDMASTTNSLKLTYKHEKTGLKIIANLEYIKNSSVIRQTTVAVNEGDEAITLNHLSSMAVNGIALGGIRPWHDKNKIKVHYCVQTWEGEGQWRKDDIEKLGLYPNSVHPCAAAIHFSSIGSWSSGRYLPMAVIEDTESGEVWYFQIETSTNWHFEIGCRGDGSEEKGAIYLQADGADERFGGWTKTLEPGDSFTSVPVAFGCCKGGFDEAIKELTKYRRTALKPNNAWDEYCPLMFNDYMNCLWGNSTDEKLVPLIDTASEAGVEGFCIDAGWFTEKDISWGFGLGDWVPSKSRYGDKGLSGILQYIKEKGMISGIWLEMEVCGEEAILAKKPNDWFLMRNGKRVGGGERMFLNFTNPEVRTYIHAIIDKLVSMGIRFIKNDYNLCIGNGADNVEENSADGLLTHSRSFYNFIDEVRLKHPKLILENCGSGAMRQDYGILSHFHVQCSSDQETYYNYPSILLGGLAAVLPEQLGIWSYPYPLLFLNIGKPEILKDKVYIDSMADGEQTIFNMVNGLCGNMYLSGRIDLSDEHNFGLIKEAVSLYKYEREHIHNSYPVWPIGFNRINDKNTWASVGLTNEENNRVLLAVWRIGSGEEYMELPIKGWTGKKAFIEQIYPSKGFEVGYSYNEQKGTMTVRFPKTFQARYFRITTV